MFIRSKEWDFINLASVKKIINTEGDTWVVELFDGSKEEIDSGEVDKALDAIIPAQPGWKLYQYLEGEVYCNPIIAWKICCMSNIVVPVAYGADCNYNSLVDDWAVGHESSKSLYVGSDEWVATEAEWLQRLKAKRGEE